MNQWTLRPVPFEFQLSDWTLFGLTLPLQMRSVRLTDDAPPLRTPTVPSDPLMDGSEGYVIRAMPVVAELPVLSRLDDYLGYVPLQYDHCYIDLSTSFEAYQKKFSSKTRSTINRKLKKFAERSGGSISWRVFSLADEMGEFLRLARIVSSKTYQERLLEVGIPDSEVFANQAVALAHEQLVRGYILFDRDQPVSYLYCPVEDGVLVYAYLGYDPDYMQFSVGTILQWLAVENMFSERRFRYFDFTEGQSDHKRLFATHQKRCANVFLVRHTPYNSALIHAHLALNRFSTCLGAVFEKLGLKAKVKRLLRFGRLAKQRDEFRERAR